MKIEEIIKMSRDKNNWGKVFEGDDGGLILKVKIDDVGAIVKENEDGYYIPLELYWDVIAIDDWKEII